MEQKHSKCYVKGHKGNDIVFVCIYEGCTNKNRVACLRCIPQHKDHCEFMINLDDLVNEQNIDIKGWPTFDQSKEILTCLKESQNHNEQKQKLIQTISDNFIDLQRKINKDIDTVKIKMIKKIEQIYQQKMENINQLTQLCMQSFNINFIIEQIKQHIINKQNEEEELSNYQNFNNLMNNLLVRDVVKIAEIYNMDSIKGEIKFDIQKFTQIKKDVSRIINQSSDLLNSLVSDNKEFMQKEETQDEQVIQDIQNVFQLITKTVPKNLSELPLTYSCQHFENGSVYQGFTLNGVRQYIGCFYFQDGDKYIGEWVNGNRQGRGIYYYEDGEIYQGFWKNDVREGYGKEFYKNGKIKYEGFFVNDKYEGEGKYYHIQGDIFQGQFKNNKPDGFGILQSFDGNQHACFYRDGTKCLENNQ